MMRLTPGEHAIVTMLEANRLLLVGILATMNSHFDDKCVGCVSSKEAAELALEASDGLTKSIFEVPFEVS